MLMSIVVDTRELTVYCFSFFFRWVHFSQLPYLPEIDALKEDLSIINQCFHHLHKMNSKETYVEAYKYAFSRKGMSQIHILIKYKTKMVFFQVMSALHLLVQFFLYF